MLKNDAVSATIWDLDVSKEPSWWCSASASPSLSDRRPLNVPENAPLQEQNSVNKKSTRLSLTHFKLTAHEEASKYQTQLPLSTSAFLTHGLRLTHTDSLQMCHLFAQSVESLIWLCFDLSWKSLLWKVPRIEVQLSQGPQRPWMGFLKPHWETPVKSSASGNSLEKRSLELFWFLRFSIWLNFLH